MAADQDELLDCPTDRLDHLLFDDPITIHQGQVRRMDRLGPKPQFPHPHIEALPERCQCDVAVTVATEDEGSAAGEAQYAVEHDIERRNDNGFSGPLGDINPSRSIESNK